MVDAFKVKQITCFARLFLRLRLSAHDSLIFLKSDGSGETSVKDVIDLRE